MRITFTSIQSAKRVAKQVSKECNCALSQCQEALAKVSGYKDWHELSKSDFAESGSHMVLDVNTMFTVTLETCELLGVNAGDLIYAFARSGFCENAFRDLSKCWTIRGMCFRALDVTYSSSFSVGDQRYVKELGSYILITKNNGSAGIVGFTDKELNGSCGDFELGSQLHKVETHLNIPLRLLLPYGFYINARGQKIIISRDYFPIWEVFDDGRPARRIFSTKTAGAQDYVWFWGDEGVSFTRKNLFEDIEALMTEMSIFGLPKTVEILPHAFQDEENLNVRDAIYKHGHKLTV